MAKSNVSQKQEALTSKYTHGVTPTQLVILSNIVDAVDGLTAALSSEEPDGGRSNPEREVFAGMAQGIWGSVSKLFNSIEKQKLEGGAA
jgi:hypothetical protein